MGVRSLNGLNGTDTSVVITNRMLATEPLEMTQPTFTDPITLSIKGLSGFGSNGQILETTGSQIQYRNAPIESNWTNTNGLLYPRDGVDENVAIGATSNPNSAKLLITNGVLEIANDTLKFTGTNQEIEFENNNENKGLYFHTSAGTTKGFKLYGVSNDSGMARLEQLENSDYMFQLYQSGGANRDFYEFNRGILNIRNAGSTVGSKNIVINFKDYNTDTFKKFQLVSDLDTETFKLKFNSSGSINDEEDVMTFNCATNNQRTFKLDKFTTSTFSSGNGANGNANLILEADTDNSVGTAVPVFQLKSSGGIITSTIQIDSSGDLLVKNNYDSADLKLSTNDGDFYVLENVVGTEYEIIHANTDTTEINSTDTLIKRLKVKPNSHTTTIQENGSIAGDITLTLPSTTGTLALTSGVLGPVWNVENNTELIADPQENDTNVCSKLTISNGAGSNGDCLLLVRADTDNSTSTSNPKIQLQQAGTSHNAVMELQPSGRLFIGATAFGYSTIISSNGGIIILSVDDGSNNLASFSQSAANFLGSNFTNVKKLVVKGGETHTTTIQENGSIAGNITLTLPSTTGTLALTSGVLGPVWNVENNTELVADPQENDTNVCSKLTISNGAGSNGDCLLLIRADTDNTVETAHPRIQLQQDGTFVNAYVELGDNDFLIGTTFSGSNTVLYTNSGEIGFSNDSGSSNNIATFSSSMTYLKSTETKVEKLLTDTIESTTTETNKITNNASNGWNIESNSSNILILKKNGVSDYPFFSTVDDNTPFQININNISGNAYQIANSNDTLAGLQHTFKGTVIFTELRGDSNSSNTLTDDGTSFIMQSANAGYILALKPSGRSMYPYIGSPSTSIVYQIHINSISGNPYEIHNTDDSQGGFQHYLNGECVKMCGERAAFQYSNPLTYFYNPEGTNGAATYGGSYFAYHNNGSAIYFNLSSGGTSSGDYFSFATNNNQVARIDMTGSGKITNNWTGSWEGTSDRRLKENIVPIENAKDTLMKINVYQFDKYDIINFNCIHHEGDETDTLKPFKERLSENTRFVYGFIAQELCENTPALGKMCVETNDWGDEEPAYIIDDRPMLACAIKTIQEQQEEINTLKEEVNTYKAIVDKLIKAPSFKAFKESLA